MARKKSDTIQTGITMQHFIIRSFISGGKLAILTLRIPNPTNSTVTCDNSPWSCLNSSCHFVAIITLCRRILCLNLMNTCRLVPSVWIISISSSSKWIFLYILSWIWKAVMCGLLGSKQQIIVFCLWPILLYAVIVWCPTKKNTVGGNLHTEKTPKNS